MEAMACVGVMVQDCGLPETETVRAWCERDRADAGVHWKLATGLVVPRAMRT